MALGLACVVVFSSLVLLTPHSSLGLLGQLGLGRQVEQERTGSLFLDPQVSANMTGRNVQPLAMSRDNSRSTLDTRNGPLGTLPGMHWSQPSSPPYPSLMNYSAYKSKSQSQLPGTHPRLASLCLKRS
jgi:hypothetical protein